MATMDHTYAGNTLDIYLNETWYNTLTADAKAAIVDKNITQYQYSYGSYDNTYVFYVDYSTKSVKNEAGNRHIYALDVEDIEKYFGGTDSSAGEFGDSDIWTLFWNTTSKPSNVISLWLRSAHTGQSNNAWCVESPTGKLHYHDVRDGIAARPAFQIDLSKIEWSPAT